MINEYGESVFTGITEFGDAVFNSLDETGLYIFGSSGNSTTFQPSWCAISFCIGGME